MIEVLLKHWKSVIIGILLVALLLSIQTCNNKSSELKVANHLLDSGVLVIKYYVDKNKKLQQQVLTEQVTVKNLKKYWSVESKGLRKQIGNLNNLVGFWKAKIVVDDTVIITVRDTTLINNGLSLTAETFNWSNGHLTLGGTLHENKDLDLNYKYQVNFTLVPYYRKRELVADLNFSDPNMRVKEFSGIFIARKESKFGIGVTAGYGLVQNGGSARFGFGVMVGANYRLTIGRSRR